MPPAMGKIVIAGAGSVGCYVGAALADAGRNVTLLLRPKRLAHIKANGIYLTDIEGRKRLVTADRFKLDLESATALANADVVLVCVKSGDTAAIAADIAKSAPVSAVAVSLQNGIGNDDSLARFVAPRMVLPGIVMFNAVLADGDDAAPVTVHRATGGGLLIPQGHDAFRALLTVDGLEVTTRPDMRAAAWGKLLLNLNNAINALSGLPLAQQLAHRAWRRILADQTAEALAILKSAGIRPAQVGSVRPQMVPAISRLPDRIFKVLAARMLAIDPSARSSMWEDLERHRRTEIDFLEGEVLRLANANGIKAPVTTRLIDLVHAAEAAQQGSPRLPPEALRC